MTQEIPDDVTKGKPIPEKMIVSDIGICTYCHWGWSVLTGCYNPDCQTNKKEDEEI